MPATATTAFKAGDSGVVSMSSLCGGTSASPVFLPRTEDTIKCVWCHMDHICISGVHIVSSVTLCSAGALMTIISVPLHLCTLSPTPLLHPPHSAHKLQCLLLLDIRVSLTGNELQLPQATQGRFLTVIYP